MLEKSCRQIAWCLCRCQVLVYIFSESKNILTENLVDWDVKTQQNQNKTQFEASKKLSIFKFDQLIGSNILHITLVNTKKIAAYMVRHLLLVLIWRNEN